MDNNKFKVKSICCKPFEDIEIHVDGSVYTCCPFWNNNAIGNIFYDSVEKIWNSEKAIELRKRILNHDYSLCNKESCLYLSKEFYSQYDTVFEPVMKEYPKRINLGYDYECNSACIICRDKVLTLPEEKLSELNSKIDSVYIPLLKNARIVTINSAGDAFASRHSRLLIKRLIEKIPNLKFEFMTNGIMASKQVFNELKITADRIETINVSLHAAKKKTYGKIVRNGEQKFDTVIRNIEYINSLNKDNNFQFVLNFVVTALNYQDLPDFIRLAEKYNAHPLIWEYRSEQNFSENKRHSELTITEITHLKYNDLKKILQDSLIRRYRQFLSPILQQIQDEGI